MTVKEKKPGPGMDTEAKIRLCAQEAEARKAQDLIALNVSELTSFADCFMICSGKSSRQVQSIADHVVRRLRDRGVRPLSVEGYRQGHWILIDYGDVIFHVFYEPMRAVYDLESLWADAEPLSVDAEMAAF